MKTKLQARILLAFTVFCHGASAQPSAPSASPFSASLLSGKALADKEREWQSCPDGYYTGPREGRRNYTNDRNLWVVTPEFAKRFCMPEYMVSAELKGAEAIAFKMVEGGSPDTCSVNDDGKHQCQVNMTGRFEIYFPSTLKLPAFNPSVEFYDNRGGLSRQLFNSGWPFYKNEPFPTKDTKFLAGSISKFKRHYLETKSPTTSDGYFFMLMYSHSGQNDKGQWPVSGPQEIAYRQNVMKGLNLVALESLWIGFNFGRDVDMSKRYGLPQGTRDGQYSIGMYRRPDYHEVKDPNNKDHKDMAERRIPEDFEHVIYLPHDFMQAVRQRAMKGGSSFQDFVNQVQQR